MKKRSYAEISRRVEALAGRHIHVETAGCIDEFPVYHVTLKGDAETACKVLLTAGCTETNRAKMRMITVSGMRIVLLSDISPTEESDSSREHKH